MFFVNIESGLNRIRVGESTRFSINRSIGIVTISGSRFIVYIMTKYIYILESQYTGSANEQNV
jgi:hypothetical protein